MGRIKAVRATGGLRIVRSVVILLGPCLAGVTARGSYSGGDGRVETPYRIATAQDIIHLSDTPADWDKHFVLVSDIDLAPGPTGGQGFDRAVIAPDNSDDTEGFQGPTFAGTFNGDGHVIRGLTISGNDYLGLFGMLGTGARVTDLGIADANVTGTGWGEGLLAGHNSGHIDRCYSSGQIRGDSCVGGLTGINEGQVLYCRSTTAVGGVQSVGGLIGENWQDGFVAHSCAGGQADATWCAGGLVGFNWGCTVNCYSTGPVAGRTYAGGLVGMNAGMVLNCYSNGEVGAEDFVGGLTGANCGGAIANSYSTGLVQGERRTGGLIGDCDDSTVTGCFWDVQMSGLSDSCEGVGLSTARMQDAGTYVSAGWDIAGRRQDGTCEVWQIPPAGGYPVIATFNGGMPPQLPGRGTTSDPYRVTSAEELGAVYYHDPSAHFRLAGALDMTGIRWSAPVIPYMAGIFEGNGGAIANLTIDGGAWLGLFGRLAPAAEVRDIPLAKVRVTGSGPRVGGLAGENYGGRVTRCSSSGIIRGTYFAGGLLGDNTGTVTGGGSDGQVSGDRYIGGLAGHNAGRVADSHSTAAVDGRLGLGGLIAYNTGDVYRCYSDGVVHGVNDVGGLVGSDYGQVRRSHSAATVEGQERIGGLVGRSDGSVTGSCAAGPVTGQTDVGGLVGNNTGGIFACSTSGHVAGQENVGGLVGHNNGQDSISGPAGHRDVYANINGSCSTSAVVGTARVGGLVGLNTGVVIDSYSAGIVTGGGKSIGGLIGDNGEQGRISNCFWDTDASGQSVSGEGTGLTTAGMRDPRTFLEAGWDFQGESVNGLHETWQMPSTDGYPVPSILGDWEPAELAGQGTPADRFLISTAADLASLAYGSQAASYRLAGDLDLSGVTWHIAVVPQFKGDFDGGGHVVRHLTISGVDHAGLFGRLSDGAAVHRLSVCDACVQGTGDRVGLLAGHNQESRVVDCHSMGEVDGQDCVGGLVGSNYWGTIAGDGSDVTVRGRNLVGGLVGDNAGPVSASRSSGDIMAGDYVGGLAGLNEGISMAISYSTANVTGRTFVGGLVGSNWFGDIADCYCTGPATGRESVGGLAGQNTGAITRCYSTTAPVGDTHVGGFVGDNEGGITASFWDVETSSMTNMCATRSDQAFGCDDACGRTTSDMQTAATFLDAGWDFVGETANGTDDLWWLVGSHDYPRLFWQIPAGATDLTASPGTCSGPGAGS